MSVRPWSQRRTVAAALARTLVLTVTIFAYLQEGRMRSAAQRWLFLATANRSVRAPVRHHLAMVRREIPLSRRLDFQISVAFVPTSGMPNVPHGCGFAEWRGQGGSVHVTLGRNYVDGTDDLLGDLMWEVRNKCAPHVMASGWDAVLAHELAHWMLDLAVPDRAVVGWAPLLNDAGIFGADPISALRQQAGFWPSHGDEEEFLADCLAEALVAPTTAGPGAIALLEAVRTRIAALPTITVSEQALDAACGRSTAPLIDSTRQLRRGRRERTAFHHSCR